MRRRPIAWLVLVVGVLAACGPGPGTSSTRGNSARSFEPARATRTLTIGVTSQVSAMSIAADSTTVGGWQELAELHSNGLVTSALTTPTPAPRLAERVPSLADGSITLLPDGRMRVVYPIRGDVTWQDGAPFTAADVVFSYQMLADNGLPAVDRRLVSEIESAEAPDPATFVAYFQGPFYHGDALWLREFWLHPRHLLQEAYERYRVSQDANEFLTLPYWTTEYVHTGPFRLASFDPGEGLTFRAYEGYFLGRPKIDVVRVRTFGDQNTLFTNVLAGAVDLFPQPAFNPDRGFELQKHWGETGQGTVYTVRGTTAYLTPQYRPRVQVEPANLDPRVRAALYQAIDRETLSEAMQDGHRELAADSVITPGYPGYQAARDGLRGYRYDPERARALLREAGWTPGPDGVLHQAADGRRYATPLWTTAGNDVGSIADYWRRVGIDVDEYTLPAPQARDRRFRSSFPGWEFSGGGAGDGILALLIGPVTSAENGWSGNRAGYENPRAEELIGSYRRSISTSDQLTAMRAVSDFVAQELPLLPLYYNARHAGVRQGVQALDDVAGAAGGPGTEARTSHLWEVQ